MNPTMNPNMLDVCLANTSFSEFQSSMIHEERVFDSCNGVINEFKSKFNGGLMKCTDFRFLIQAGQLATGSLTSRLLIQPGRLVPEFFSETDNSRASRDIVRAS